LVIKIFITLEILTVGRTKVASYTFEKQDFELHFWLSKH